MRQRKLSPVLGGKLLAIRHAAGMSQGKMLQLVMPGAHESNRVRVSQWERGIREPSREALVRYSRVVGGVTLEALLDDELELPAHIKRSETVCIKRSFIAAAP